MSICVEKIKYLSYNIAVAMLWIYITIVIMRKGSESMSIGECIKEKRVALGYSQERLAKLIGIGQPMMAQIERGTKIPNMLLGKSIAQALECRIEELYGED